MPTYSYASAVQVNELAAATTTLRSQPYHSTRIKWLSKRACWDSDGANCYGEPCW